MCLLWEPSQHRTNFMKRQGFSLLWLKLAGKSDDEE